MKFIARAMEGVETKDLKAHWPTKPRRRSWLRVVVALANRGADGKGGVVVAVTPDLTDRFNAVDFVRIGAAQLGGKGGGGRPDMAQAGGPDGAATEQAIAAIEDALRERIAS